LGSLLTAFKATVDGINDSLKLKNQPIAIGDQKSGCWIYPVNGCWVSRIRVIGMR
jgi:hypothetical protein